jgi:hypothetical protein
MGLVPLPRENHAVAFATVPHDRPHRIRYYANNRNMYVIQRAEFLLRFDRFDLRDANAPFGVFAASGS